MKGEKGTKRALLFGAVPFAMLVLVLPPVNRIEPMILRLPFILFRIITRLLLTPLFLFLAYRGKTLQPAGKKRQRVNPAVILTGKAPGCQKIR